MSDVWNDPDFQEYLDWFRRTHQTFPGTADILIWMEAKATVALERE